VQLFIRLGGSRLLIPAEYGALGTPCYVPVAEASAYAADSEVLGLELNGEAKAIPVKRIAWHLVVNDQIGGQPVAITLCTVTNAAVAYRATVGERRLEFAPARLARNQGEGGQSDLQRKNPGLWAVAGHRVHRGGRLRRNTPRS
jgi:hypothetical protein